MKHGSQIFRFDKTLEQAQQDGFFIAGINALVTICFTIARLDEHSAGSVYIPYAQAILTVRDSDYSERRTYNLQFLQSINWFPTDIKNQYHYSLEKIPKPKGKNPADADAKGVDPGISHGTLDMTHEKHVDFRSEEKHTDTLPHNMHSESKDPLQALSSFSVHKDHKGEMKEMTDKEMKEAKDSKEGGSGVYSLEALHNKTMRNMAIVQQEARGQKMRINYFPNNPIASMGLLVMGPPLEELRKPPDMYSILREQSLKANKASHDDTGNALPDDKPAVKKKGNLEGRLTVWWLALCNLRLYFYQFHGDIKPRLIADISHAQVEVSTEYSHGTVISILFQDKRHWYIECEDKKIAQRFEFAVVESQKALHKKGGSIFMKSDEVNKKSNRDYGFHMHIY